MILKIYIQIVCCHSIILTHMSEYMETVKKFNMITFTERRIFEKVLNPAI